MVGNFLGDFVKGSRLENLPVDIKQGVLLHRTIDSFTDSHPLVTSLKSKFPRHLRRMSGVVIDVYFDYLLCTYWREYSEQALKTVLTAFYADLSANNLVISNRFNHVKHGLLTHEWLIDYEHKDGCIRAFYQIEQRLNGRIEFAQYANDFLDNNHQLLEQTFIQFYPALIKYVNTTVMNAKLQRC